MPNQLFKGFGQFPISKFLLFHWFLFKNVFRHKKQISKVKSQVFLLDFFSEYENRLRFIKVVFF